MYSLNELDFNLVKDIYKNYIITNYAKNYVDNFNVNNLDYDTIIRFNNETKEAFDSIIKLGNIDINLKDNLFDILKRLSLQSTLNIEEIISILDLIDTSSSIKRYEKNLKNLLNIEYLKDYFNNISNLDDLKNQINYQVTKDGKILDNASRELFIIRKSLQSLSNRLHTKLNELLSLKSKMLSEPLIVLRDERYCLPFKIEYKNQIKGVIHDTSSSNTTVYIEPEETLQLSNEIENFKAKEKKEIDNILKGLSLLINAKNDILNINLNNIIRLDIIYAKALMGKENNYNFFKINNENKFNLIKVKHPLIDKDKCVPLNISIGKNYDSIIITGPNTGGKTVTLKTTGLIHIMGYLGLMLPLDESSCLGYFENILADIGDKQSIIQNLSTFSSHMKNIKNIIDIANDKSLILLDELGSGTDPKEGASLGIAIIKNLREKGSNLIVTTHYADLKNYAYQEEKISNASVEFDLDTLSPTYKLLMGISGKSNAIDISKKLGIQDEIINSALEIFNSGKSDNDHLISNLENEMNDYNSKKYELEQLLNKAKEEEKKLKEERISLSNKSDQILARARHDADEIVKQAKAKSQELINEIKNMSDRNFKENELAELKYKVRSLDDNTNIEAGEGLNVGDFVKIVKYEKYGTITKYNKNKGLYSVRFGSLEMDFKRSELRLSAKPEKKPEIAKKRNITYNGYISTSDISSSLDLRGKRYEEVKELCDNYLDRASIKGYDEVSLIHGFGTGAVRKAVMEYLKTSKYVESYRYGVEGEGLNGVTICKLKKNK